MTRRVRHAISRQARIFFVVGGLFFVAEARAWGACGAHTVFSFQTVAAVAPSNKSLQTSSNLTIRTRSVPQPCDRCPAAPSEAPCRGPQCSGQSAPQGVPVTGGSMRTALEPLTLVDDSAIAIPDQRDEWLAASVPASAVPRTDSIFHPPRAR